MIVLYSIIAAYMTVLVISYWTGLFGRGLSGKGMLITGLLSFLAILLFQIFAPESWKFPALVIGFAILMITLLIFSITSRRK
jgi:hypothetical protein